MDNSELKKILDNSNGELDVFEPTENHFLRFEEKLGLNGKEVKEPVVKKIKNQWFVKLAMAASVLLIGGLGVVLWGLNNQPESALAKISPEMEKTQDFFHNAIQYQIEQIEKTASLETSKIVEDGMQQLQKLEFNYQKLEKDLLQSNNNPKVISAMILNFQKRIELLENILEKINSYSLQKNEINESNIL